MWSIYLKENLILKRFIMQYQILGLELRRACPIFLIGFGQEQTMALDTSPSFHSWRSPEKLPKSTMMRWKISKKNWHKRCKHETKCLWVAPVKKKNKLGILLR